MSKPLKIMLVDDNETDNLITSKIIEMHLNDVEIQDFTVARQALQYLYTNAGNGAALPDIIFLDIQMPVVSGMDFLFEMDKLMPTMEKDVKVVMLSSYEKVQDRILISPRVLDYVSKPLSPENLGRILKEFAARKLKVA